MRNDLIEYVNSSADGWIGWVIAATLDSAALLAVVGLVWIAIRRRVAPQVGYGLFLLVPLKLLLPIDVAVPAAIANWTPSGLVSSWLTPSLDRHLTARADGRAPRETRTSTNDSGRPERATAATGYSSDLSAADAAGGGGPLATTTGPRAQIASAPAASIRDAPESTRLTVSALALIVWLTCVLWLLGRTIGMQIKFHSRLKKLSPVDGRQLGLDLGELCRRVGTTESIRIIEADDLAAPAVWGIARPTIILPRGVASALTARQLQWVLLHELAHIRRRDLLIVVVQRFATVLHFFNPIVWIANRIIDRLREYACDDLADAASDGSAADSSEAFVQILRHANRSRQSLAGALGVFGWDARSSCFVRVRRLLDSDRPIRTRSSPWSFCGLLLVAAVALPHLRAGADSDPSDPPKAAATAAARDPSKANVGEALASDVGEFELRVVAPDGKRVPEALVHVHGSSTPTAEQIRRGKFVRKAAYGVYVKADSEGRIVVKFSSTPSRFQVTIEIPGYGPYWASWSSESYTQPIPARFTAELEAAWSVGGIIVDGDGKPVEGAQVHPNIRFKKRPGDESQLHVGEHVKTDAAGKWRYESVPVSMTEVYVEIDHPGFSPNRRELPRGEFGIETGQEPSGRIALDRGLVVAGTVTDDAGLPIAGALVRTKFFNEKREAKTGENGTYRLVGCEPRLTKIVVSAKGRATDMQEVLVDPEMPRVDFQMHPGGKVRIRVVDQQGKPVPKARILFQRWRGPFFDYFEFDHVNQYADENGVWEWNEAPLDEFRADICPPDAMYLARQPLIARDEEYVFRTPPALVISGRAIDAKTKKPIEKFAVVPGSRLSESMLSWSDRDRFTVTDGNYRVRHASAQIAHLIRIEAAGYRAAVSREIQSDEGIVSVDFELEQATDVAATVLTPAGRPAAKARIAVGIEGAQISILNGEIRDISTFCAQLDTTEAGRFQMPAPETPFQLVILHPAGYAHVKSTPDSMPATITLEAWARVEGTFRVGRKPVPDAMLAINVAGFASFGQDAPRIHSEHRATTDAEGRFVFERVIPGRARIGREVVNMVKEGIIPFGSSGMIPRNLAAGETAQIELGGTGRSVVGRLRPPDDFKGTVDWHFALVQAGLNVAEPPEPDGPDIPADIAVDPAKKAAWMLTWRQTPAGKTWTAWYAIYEANQRLRSNSPFFKASVNRDGTFRIDDMPEGDYTLSVINLRDLPGSLQDFRFTVPSMDDVTSRQPLDVGDLTLHKE